MSNFISKDRRHKEANLSGVISIIAGPPLKTSEKNITELAPRSLTINFEVGGGIDLIFYTESSRDLWRDTLKKIILSIKKK